ncbi:thiamine pyrophosphate-requiring protein [Microbacterium wangchenii]|uniref:Thiamine pyrophosphate-requiring protein n=1 Tax=Microbacterium wangchenii TaxID=2541726 RepID=A0ABX5SYI3_9MICO|nr:thiamine pyrophosphate-requiring protein [Microbacterium wangchenii]
MVALTRAGARCGGPARSRSDVRQQCDVLRDGHEGDPHGWLEAERHRLGGITPRHRGVPAVPQRRRAGAACPWCGVSGAERSAGQLIVDALREAGVTHLFANFGSDHPAIIEALAADRESGIDSPVVILCPHEYTALSAAHGYAAVTGKPQAVFVHTDVGTANLGGAVHNAARSRVPVFVFAGLTPYTLEGELPGSRNSFVNHLQDVPDQHGIVRPYVKWSYDIRTAVNAAQIVHRSLQIARSAPAGPVYVTAAREVLAERVSEPRREVAAQWRPVEPSPAPPDAVDDLFAALSGAERPVIITTYLGRSHAAVGALVRVAERLGVAVVEHNAEVVNFPRDHPLHAGDDPHRLIADADVILAIDTDVPWVDAIRAPGKEASVFVVNEDPLQESLPLWYVRAGRFIRADGALVLEQLEERCAPTRDARAAHRAQAAAEDGVAVRRAWAGEVEADVRAGRLTPASVSATLSGLLDDDTIVVNEAISAAPTVWKHLPRRRPGTLYGNRGTSLGWSGGGALGVKLAAPERTVVSIVGDGTFFFSVPSSTYWIAHRYGLPVLTVVLDNGGWNATKRNVERIHPDGVAVRSDRYWVNLQQSADFGGIAAAAGEAWSAIVSDLGALEGALRAGLEQVRAGTSAVVTVRMDPISRQPDEPVPTEDRARRIHSNPEGHR